MMHPHADRTLFALPDFEGRDTSDMLEDLLCRVFPGRIALVSSFGAESAVLLHLAAAIDPAIPVIFLDTGKLFPETLRYRDTLVDHFRLRDVRSVRPNPSTTAAADPDGRLWDRDPDLCCWHRKVAPLDAALSGFDAWITGRKRFQAGLRATLPRIEHQPDGRVRVNPLASWTPEQIDITMIMHGLPRHELVDRGFPSIGCAPCTRPTAPNEAVRAGRWTGSGKTECGIHLPRPGPGHMTKIAGRGRIC